MNKPHLVEVTNIGDTVVCDGCNGPYGENMMGGVLIGYSAYCGECSDKYGYDKPNYEYADEITEVMLKSKTFKENVLDYRKKTTGSTDGISKFYSF